MKKFKLLMLSMFIMVLLTTGCGAEKVYDSNVKFIDRNDSYFIKINGKKFMAGDKIASLSSVGYTLKSNEVNFELPANKYMIGAGNMVNSNNENIFDVTPFNITSSKIKVSDSVIGGLNLSYVWAKKDKKSADFEVYGGIKLGSTKEEVESAFGKPNSVVNNNVYKYVSEETYRSYTFTFDDEEKVSDIEWRNIVFNRKMID